MCQGTDPTIVKDFYFYVFTKLDNWGEPGAGEILPIQSKCHLSYLCFIYGAVVLNLGF